MENAVQIYNSTRTEGEKVEALCQLRETLDRSAQTLKKHKADIDIFLIQINTRAADPIEWENQDGTAKIEVKEGYKYKVNVKKFLELLSIPEHLEKFLASGWFKIGELKKEKGLDECWEIQNTGVIKVTRKDPEMMAEIKARRAQEKEGKAA